MVTRYLFTSPNIGPTDWMFAVFLGSVRNIIGMMCPLGFLLHSHLLDINLRPSQHQQLCLGVGTGTNTNHLLLHASHSQWKDFVDKRYVNALLLSSIGQASMQQLSAALHTAPT